MQPSRVARCFAATVLLLALAWSGLAAAQPRAPGMRAALVIGNDRYVHQPELTNAGRDAQAVAATLTGMGFRVRSHENLTRAGMVEALLAFVDEARGAEVAVVYYAGHGMQITADGLPENYLVPVDARLRDVRTVADETVPLTRLLRELAEARVLIVLLDACRDNPVAQRMASQGMRATTRSGLAPVPESISQGALIAFAASPGQFAEDGQAGGNGPFAAALVKHLPTPGVDIGRVFQRAAAEVRTVTRDRQRPEVLNRLLLTDDLFLAGPVLAPAVSPATPTATIPSISPAEAAFWAEVRDGRNPGDLRAYLEAYPGGVFAPLARSRLAALASPISVPAPAARLEPAAPPRPAPPAPDSAPQHACDRLAQPLRNEIGRVTARADGVAWERLDAPAARAACAEAMATWPDNVRFIAYAGRAAAKGRDDVEAVRLSRLAAGQGHPEAQNTLGVMYQSGRGGLARDDAEAVRLYRLAADQGHTWAQYNLGLMYENGRGGLARDEREAVRLYRLAADQGNASAQSILGLMYQYGRGGLAQDEREAVRLYRLAADQGNARGQVNLGFMYESGRGGLTQDGRETVRLYRLAADQGDTWAQTALRRMEQQ